jgi:anti-anti-sigma regulatory factor
MNIATEHVAAPVAVAIVRLEGDLDATNYEQLIATGRELAAGGARHILVDLRQVPYMGSSGLVALHSVVLAFAGEEALDVEGGWGAHHAIAHSADQGLQNGLRLLGPVPAVRRALERTGMSRFIEIHEDEAQALAAFA